jgi:beta-N-acetylhexosaminidase
VLQTLLRADLGFDGVVVTDALEMRGARGTGSVANAAAEAFVAGADLLCLGPRQGPDVIAATVAAVAGAVRQGRVTPSRLDAAAERIARLHAHPVGAAPDGAAPDGADAASGIEAARAAVRIRGTMAALVRPLVVELQAPATIAAGAVPWGIGPWLPDGNGAEVVGLDHDGVSPAALLARAAGRSLVVVVRDAHRHPWMVGVVETLINARPDTVVIEMGLPVWQPHHAGPYIATYGAAQANAAAALELLGAG